MFAATRLTFKELEGENPDENEVRKSPLEGKIPKQQFDMNCLKSLILSNIQRDRFFVFVYKNRLKLAEILTNSNI